jgi:hypothetical protein
MAKPTFRKEDDYGFITGTGIEMAYGMAKMFKKGTMYIPGTTTGLQCLGQHQRRRDGGKPHSVGHRHRLRQRGNGLRETHNGYQLSLQAAPNRSPRLTVGEEQEKSDGAPSRSRIVVRWLPTPSSTW